MFPEDTTYGIGDILRLQFGGGYLIEKGEKSVIVVFVDNKDINVSLCQSPGCP
jgi:hypothetical protein